MKSQTYIIHYRLHLTDGQVTTHTTKVKNCMSDLHAKVKLEGYLKKKHPLFEKMVVKNSHVDSLDIFDFFNTNIFK